MTAADATTETPAPKANLESAGEVSSRRVTKNAAASYIGAGLAVPVAIVTQAVLIRGLGKEMMSLWPLVAAGIGFLRLIPVGIGGGTARYLSHAIGSKDRQAIREITATLFWAMCGAAFVYFAASTAISLFFDRIFDLPEHLRSTARICMFLMGLTTAVSLPFMVYRGGLAAAQHFWVLEIIGVVKGILALLLIAALLLCGFRTVTIVAVVTLITTLLQRVAATTLSLRVMPDQDISLRHFRTDRLRELTGYNLMLVLSSIAGLLYHHTDIIIINKCLDPIHTTGYNVVGRTALQCHMLGQMGCQVLLPALTVLFARREIERMTRGIYRATRVAVLIAAPFLLMCVLLGPQILTLYIGEQYASYGRLYILLAGVYLLTATQTATAHVPAAFGKVRTIAVASFVWALVNAGLSLFFVLQLGWGLWGVAAGTFVASALNRCIWFPWYVSRLLGVSFMTFYANVFVIPLLYCVPVALTIWLASRWLGAEGWLTMSAVAGLALCVHGIGALIWGLPQQERASARQMLVKVWRRLRRPLVCLLVSLALLGPAMLIFADAIAGDPSIYFTYIRNFTRLPFSYQPGIVAFGATSPLHVVTFAPLYSLIGPEHWLDAAKALNLLMIAAGAVFINRALRGNLATLCTVCFLIVLNKMLFIYTAQLFETGLAFLVMSATAFLALRRQFYATIVVTGLLYLVRPELLLVALTLTLWAGVSAWRLDRSPRRILLAAALWALPALTYHGWVFVAAGEIVPSSIQGRAVRALEYSNAWPDRIREAAALLSKRYAAIYQAGALALLVVLVTGNVRRYRVELMMTLPLVALYAVSPPGNFLVRYLQPVTPVIALLTVGLIFRTVGYLARERRRATAAAEMLLAFASILGITWYSIGYAQYKPRQPYDRATILLKDLATQLNPLLRPGDKVLVYEIQSQYYLNAHCVSLDGIVGSDLHPALLGRESFTDYLRRTPEARFIVTMNSLNYRAIFDETALESLYEHDLASSVGAECHIDGIVFRKVLTNPAFANPAKYRAKPWSGHLNTGRSLRVYGDWNPERAGISPSWNSVYEIAGAFPAGGNEE